MKSFFAKKQVGITVLVNPLQVSMIIPNKNTGKCQVQISGELLDTQYSELELCSFMNIGHPNSV